eukprot:TRINITY_DN2033_c8_g1_i1.p1 TRINITY_DN2033_c8_g1~~TRINITY_DN2033_c8_g1_i1.p1  ORF type:complete len:198 (+),score=25.80 TRINITY_DN2033_c8_g1_i1:93-686(+)
MAVVGRVISMPAAQAPHQLPGQVQQGFPCQSNQMGVYPVQHQPQQPMRDYIPVGGCYSGKTDIADGDIEVEVVSGGWNSYQSVPSFPCSNGASMHSVPSPHDPYYTPPAPFAGFHYPCFRFSGPFPFAAGTQVHVNPLESAIHETESCSSRGRTMEHSGVSSARSRSAASTESGDASELGTSSRPRSHSQPPAVVEG